MTLTFLFGVLLALLILVRSVRWIAMIVLLVAIGYLAHGGMGYLGHDEGRNRTIVFDHHPLQSH